MKADAEAFSWSDARERNRRVAVFALPFGLSVALLICLALSGNLALQVLLFLFGLASVWVISGADDGYRESLVAAYTVAYALRLLWILVIARTGPAFAFLDDRSYNSMAQEMVFRVGSLSDFMHLGAAFGSSNFGYPFILASLYQTVGYSLLSAKVLNAFFGAATVLLVYLLIEDLSGDTRLAVVGAWIMAWFGYDVAMTTWLMKDTLLLFFFSLAIVGSIRAYRRRSLCYAAAAAVGFFAAFLIRFYSFGEIMIGAAIAILAAMAERAFPGSLPKRWGAFLFMIGAGAAAVWLALGLLAGFGPLADFIQGVHYVNQLAETPAGQLSGVRVLQLSLSGAAVKQLVRAVLRYFFAPFAWVFEAPNSWDYFTYPGMLMIYALFPFAVAGVWDSVELLRPVALFAFVPALVHATATIYVYQGGSRQRMMTDVLFVAAACLGWKARGKHPLLITAAYLGFIPLIYFQKRLQGA